MLKVGHFKFAHRKWCDSCLFGCRYNPKHRRDGRRTFQSRKVAFSIPGTIVTFLVLQAISLYTLVSIWLRKDISSMKFTLGVITCVWIFIAIIVSVGNATHHNPSFMSPTPVGTCLLFILFMPDQSRSKIAVLVLDRRRIHGMANRR